MIKQVPSLLTKSMVRYTYSPKSSRPQQFIVTGVLVLAGLGWAECGKPPLLDPTFPTAVFSSGKDGQGGTRPTSSTLSLHCTRCTALLCAALNHHYYTTTLTSLILTSSKRPPPHPRVRSHNSQGSIRFRRRWAHSRRCSALHLSIRVHDHLGLPRITGSWR